ncbi:MAG: helix-turn-helix domain-containing protein, partial [Acidimicrobiia bacterium]|nr:helix-turn-helix domain-containing protein [Acidimicrobiia bacterium]
MAESSFSEFITARRRELELTLGDVANGLGVSPITVSNWSNGQAIPKPEQVTALAELLEVEPGMLSQLAGVPNKPEAGINLMPVDEAPQQPAPVVEASPPEPTEPATADVPESPAVSADEPVSADEMDSELAELIEEASAEIEPPPLPVGASVGSPETGTGAATIAEPARTERRPRRLRRPDRAGAERPVTTLPLTYVEDPKQLMRYRIRWALTVVILVIMFFILLWASRELLSS